VEVKLSEKAAAIVAEQVAKGWYASPEDRAASRRFL
jgi:hypothetical protein